MKYSPAGKVRLIVLLLLILVIIVGAGWFYLGGVFREKEIRNVLLISIDTCRADHLSCYGYPRKTTINIDNLAQEGVLFANTYSPVPMTLPSHSSMLTGTIPPYHGVHDNLEYRLGESNVTLAEILGQKGFATGAVISSFVLDSQFGIGQGFDYYNDHFEETITTGNINERRGDESTRFALEWLGEHKDEKFFFFLHYYDPHLYYDPPEPFASKFSDNLYAGEIAYTDYCIGQVIQRLKDLGLYDSTLIIITGDHGELFDDHGENGHGYFIYQGAIKVPLIVKLPGRGKSRVIEDPVGIIDIVPTICSLLGLDIPEGLQGQDLSGYLLGKEITRPDRHIYCESLYPTKYLGNTLLAVVTDQWKYIQTTRPELYDIVQDPGETNNLYDQERNRGRILRDKLKQILEETVDKDKADNKMILSEQDRHKLESLGYVSGSVSEDFEFDQTKDDPKDIIEVHMLNEGVNSLIIMKEYALARKKCRKMLLLRPQYYKTHVYLGKIAMEEGKFTEATNHLKKAIEMNPEAWSDLGLAYLRSDEFDLAIASFKKAVEYEPDNHKVYFNLGLAYSKKRMFDRAIKYYRKVIEINPKYYNAHANLGMAFKDKGKITKAIKTWEHLLAIEPGYPGVRNNLDLAGKEKKRLEELVSVWTRAIAENPDNSESHINLGDVYFRLDLLEKTIYHWQMALQLQPGAPGVMNNLAYLLATERDEKFFNPSKAIGLAGRACELTENKDARYLDTLAIAYGAGGEFAQAIETAQKAIKAAQLENQPILTDDIKSRLELYKAGKVYR